MGLLDFLFSIVKAICGESSQPEGEKPTGAQRPPRPQEPLSPLPGAWPTVPQQDRLRYQVSPVGCEWFAYRKVHSTVGL